MVTRRWNESDEAKSSYIKELFSALAKRYNVMTDVWTLGSLSTGFATIHFGARAAS
jgi:hypothetical protein